MVSKGSGPFHRQRNFDTDYDAHGGVYGQHRRGDPRIARLIRDALGDARDVLNVGAGTGSYEPDDRRVAAVEPSAVMRAQRSSNTRVVAGVAEALPFGDCAFDGAMAILTVHHWSDRSSGLREMRRVARGPMVILTFDPAAETEFWLNDYVPEMSALERERYGPIESITSVLAGRYDVVSVPVPADCQDGFRAAFFARPEAFLNDQIRQSQSSWRLLPDGVEARFVRELRADLQTGRWDERYGALRSVESMSCQLRLIVAQGT